MGQQSQAGAELARRELGASGINIEIVYEDHRTDAKVGVVGAKKLLDIDGVDAVLCDLTPPCIAASPVVAAAKKILMYQAPVVSILSTNPYAFKNFLDYQDGCERIALFWKQTGITRVAHFKVNAEFGELCLKGAHHVFPTAEEIAYDSNDDLRPLVTRIKSSDVQAVFQTGYEADYINRLKAAADIGLSLPTAMPQPLLTQNVEQAVSPVALAGTVAFGFPHISAEFVNRLKSAGLYRSPVSIESAAVAYMHVKQLAASIGACGKQGIDCELRHVSSSPADSVLGFKAWNNRVASYDYVLRRWADGKFVDIGSEQAPGTDFQR